MTNPAVQSPRCPMTGAALLAPEVGRDQVGTGVGHDALVADWVQPAALVADPYPTYERLRRESPIAWVPALNRYLVTTYRDCHAIECDQQTYSADVAGQSASMKRALGGQPMVRKDDPEHAAERSTINPTVRPKMIKARWAELFTRNAHRYLDRLAEIGPDAAELNRDYASPVASQNLIDVLGLPDVDVADMRRWSHAFVAGTGNVLDDPDIWLRCERAGSEVDALLNSLLPHYQRHPDESMTSALANSGLPREVVAANIKLTITGGMNEPQHMITNMVWALSEHPGQRSEVLTEPTMWSAVFDEAVRMLSPIGMYPRRTTKPVVRGDVRLPAEAQIGVVVASANRDEKHFASDPSVFDIHRPRQPHLAFGSGVHLCAGHWVARSSVGDIAVPLLYDRFPGLRIDSRRETSWEGWVFRGLTNLPVTWDN